METLSTYDQQAADFMEKTGTEFKATFLASKAGHFGKDDTTVRDVYSIELKRGRQKYTFDFGQSVVNSYKPASWKEGKAVKGQKRIPPTPYDVFACLQKYNPLDFENFCDDFGYSTDSIKAKKTYKAVVKEWLNISAMYSHEELDILIEIQ